MKSVFLCAFVALLLSGCITHPGVTTHVQEAKSASHPSTYHELVSLPDPRGAIPVSVYGFRDQTGQYKPQQNVSSFSTAVTQGATSILMEALTHSKWFLPLEREGLQNILTERKIIRAAQKKQNKDDLPPLVTSSIILEGGIISYDSNVFTAGAGIGYYGVSVGEQYRQDQISVYLRAVDVRSGRVLASVSTNKTVLSKEIRSGFYRFISIARLGEFEAGYSSNEPMHICVVQAVQKAVTDLIIVGVKKGIWALKNPEDINAPGFERYEQEQANRSRYPHKEAVELDDDDFS